MDVPQIRALKPRLDDDLASFADCIRSVCDRVENGEKGPMVWEAKSIPICPENEDGLPRQTYLLVVARNVLAPDEVTCVASNAPLGTPLPTLFLVVAGGALRRGREGELGPDHFEWLKRHLILTAVSHLFRAKAHQELRGGKNPELTVCQVRTAPNSPLPAAAPPTSPQRGEVEELASLRCPGTGNRPHQKRITTPRSRQ